MELCRPGIWRDTGVQGIKISLRWIHSTTASVSHPTECAVCLLCLLYGSTMYFSVTFDYFYTSTQVFTATFCTGLHIMYIFVYAFNDITNRMLASCSVLRGCRVLPHSVVHRCTAGVVTTCSCPWVWGAGSCFWTSALRLCREIKQTDPSKRVMT